MMFFRDTKGLAKTVAELGRLVEIETSREKRTAFIRELQEIADDPTADNGSRLAAFAIVSEYSWQV